MKNFIKFLQNNPKTYKAIGLGLLGILSIIIVVLNKNSMIIPIIFNIFGARLLLGAKKDGEDKRLIKVAYGIVYMPVIWLITNSLIFLILTLR